MTKSEAEKQGFEVLIAIPMTKIAQAKEKEKQRIYGGYNRCKTNQF
jgi:hypothetical protein